MIMILSDITLCNLADNRYFRGTHYLHLQGGRTANGSIKIYEFYPEDGGCSFLQNTATYLPDYIGITSKTTTTKLSAART
jgi:hypothetical protein